jgi:hypothetical protein
MLYTMKDYFTDIIKDKEEAKEFIVKLYLDGNMFVFDDPASSFVSNSTGEPAFTARECEYLDARVAEVFQYMEDPFELCLALVS